MPKNSSVFLSLSCDEISCILGMIFFIGLCCYDEISFILGCMFLNGLVCRYKIFLASLILTVSIYQTEPAFAPALNPVAGVYRHCKSTNCDWFLFTEICLELFKNAKLLIFTNDFKLVFRLKIKLLRHSPCPTLQCPGLDL